MSNTFFTKEEMLLGWDVILKINSFYHVILDIETTIYSNTCQLCCKKSCLGFWPGDTNQSVQLYLESCGIETRCSSILAMIDRGAD